MDQYHIRGIVPQLIPDLWRFAEPYIKRALDHTFGELRPQDLQQLCATESAQLWMVSKGKRIVGAGTTQIVVYPTFKSCRIITLAGSEFDEWKDYAYAYLAVWARARGCGSVEAYVRKGFVPKLLEIGFKHRYSVVHKELE